MGDEQRVRSLVRLSVRALRRTALENSARPLAAAVSVVFLADGAPRVTTLRALDAWFIGALTWAVILPVALAGDDPLRSVRLTLLPVPDFILRRVRFIAGAPMRLIFVLALPILGVMATHGVVPQASPT